MDFKKIPITVHYDDTKYERVRWLQSMFGRYENYYRNEIQRLIGNQRMYWGVNFGQWPAYAVEKLIAQGRRPPTFNIIAKKIESQIGSFLSNGFDIKYETRNGKDSHWAVDIMDMMFHEKSMCDWETSKIVVLRDMHCMVGYERMLISERADSDFGNIAWEPCPPTHIYVDPAWRSSFAYDIENYFEWGHFSVSKICRMFPKAAQALRELREHEEVEGINYGDYMGGPQRYTTTEEKWNDFHRVITFHSLQTVERKWPYDVVNRIPFPETGHQPGSLEDIAIKGEYMRRAGLQEGQWVEVTQKRRIKRVEAICPSLNSELFLAAGKDRIQTNNCNIYPMGNQFYGQYRGVVDDLADVQLQFNKGKMTIEDILLRTAKGAFVLDRALTGGDDAKRAEIEQRWNDPAARIWVEDGATAELGSHGGIIELPAHQASPDMFRTNAENLDLADLLSTMPAAMDARTESSSESGKLYQAKYQVGLISQKYGMKIWERHEKEKAQAYALQVKLTHAGYPREFRRIGGKEVLVLNQPAADSTGRGLILNDISVMPEMNVILTPSPAGTNIKTELRNQYIDSMQYVSKDPELRLLFLLFMDGVFKTQDMAEEDKEGIHRANELLITNEGMRLALKNVALKKQVQQIGQAPQEQPPQQSVSDGRFNRQQAIAATPQDENRVLNKPPVTEKGATQ